MYMKDKQICLQITILNNYFMPQLGTVECWEVAPPLKLIYIH